MRKILDFRTISIALAVVSVWAIVVVLSGSGVNLFENKWNFENTAQFGDSFGSLSAIMASLAALSALATFRLTQVEIERSNEKDRRHETEQAIDRRRLKERESAVDDRLAKTEFERTFFQLLGTFNAIVADIDYTVQSKQHQDKGRDAFRKILDWFENQNLALENHKRSFELTADKFANDLFHYFRFLYHVINFVHTHEGVDRYFYVRLVRALLSDAEISLIALNCIYGQGRGKFKILVEEYSLLHNLSEKYKDRLDLEGRFYPRAFGRGLAPSRLGENRLSTTLEELTGKMD